MIYDLKGRLLKNLLVFSRKIEYLTFFFHCCPPNRGKRGKNSPFGPRLSSSAKIGHVGVYCAKMGCKIEGGFTDIFGFQVRYFVLDRSARWGLTVTTGLLIRFAAKREKWLKTFPWRSHLFSSLISALRLMNVYMNTGIK